jgi:hypothetical protein
MGTVERGVCILEDERLDEGDTTAPRAVAFHQDSDWGAVLFLTDADRANTVHAIYTIYRRTKGEWEEAGGFGNPWFDADIRHKGDKEVETLGWAAIEPDDKQVIVIPGRASAEVTEVAIGAPGPDHAATDSRFGGAATLARTP